MSILIKGMDMPDENQCVTVRIWGTGLIQTVDDYHSFIVWNGKATEIPPYGDLIDRDAIINALQELFDKRARDAEFTGNRGACVTWNDAIYHIKSAPTIIPADVSDRNVGNILAERTNE